jgi:hypothetical protein
MQHREGSPSVDANRNFFQSFSTGQKVQASCSGRWRINLGTKARGLWLSLTPWHKHVPYFMAYMGYSLLGDGREGNNSQYAVNWMTRLNANQSLFGSSLFIGWERKFSRGREKNRSWNFQRSQLVQINPGLWKARWSYLIVHPFFSRLETAIFFFSWAVHSWWELETCKWPGCRRVKFVSLQ